MNTYIGNDPAFTLTETLIGPFGAQQYSISVSWSSIASGAYTTIFQYRPLSGGSWTSSAGGTTSPRTFTIPYGNYEYQILVYTNPGAVITTISFTLQQVDQNNFLFIPETNPLVFNEVGKTNLPNFFTKHFIEWPFEERGYYFEDKETYCQPWQATDIISLQMESSFSPLILQLLNMYDDVIIERSASAIMPHLRLPNLYSYEFAMSLAGVPTNCYRFQLVAGFGSYQRIYRTGFQYIKDGILENTMYFSYCDSKPSHKDVMWITGIKMNIRLPVTMGLLEKVRKDEYERNQSNNPNLLNSKSSKQFPIVFGRPEGLPEEQINIIDEMWGCDTVLGDNVLLSLTADAKYEYTRIPRSRKRFLSTTVEYGLNRYSRVHQTIKDPAKRLITTAMVDPKVWGLQTGSNTIPVINIE